MTELPYKNIQCAQAIRPFHVVVYTFKKEKNHWHLLLLRRVSSYLNKNWQMVSGGVNSNETAWQGALRELKEETNLVPNRFYSADAVESFYEVARDAILIAPVFVAFVENDQEIRLSAHEHDQFKWATIEEALSILEFENQHRVLRHIEKYFLAKHPNERFRIPL